MYFGRYSHHLYGKYITQEVKDVISANNNDADTCCERFLSAVRARASQGADGGNTSDALDGDGAGGGDGDGDGDGTDLPSRLVNHT